MSDDNTPAQADDGFDFATADAEALKAEVQALKEQVLRYAAEAENTRRRAEREMNDARAYAIQKFARDLLGVADNLDRAMTAAPADHAESAVKNFVVGVEMTAKELLGAFERTGLKKIDPAKGEKFDPNKHQAISMVEADAEPNTVVTVLQKGYLLSERVIRPAMVMVSKGKAQ